MKIPAINTTEKVAFHYEFRARMSGLVDFTLEQWRFEREYWEKKRLLD